MADDPLPLSTHDRITYIPEYYGKSETPGGKLVYPPTVPTYALAPLTRRERQAAQRDTLAECGAEVSTTEWRTMTRRGIEAVRPDAERAESIALVDALDALDDELQTTVGSNGQEESLERKVRREALNQQYEVLQNGLSREYPPLARLFAVAQRRVDTLFRMFAARSLRGWTNVPATFERIDGRVPDAALDCLPGLDVDAIGIRAAGLARLTEAEAKN